jgi:hypothetical protein
MLRIDVPERKEISEMTEQGKNKIHSADIEPKGVVITISIVNGARDRSVRFAARRLWQGVN